MTYPEYVRIRGEKVKIKTDTKTALKCLKIVNDNDIGDYERALAIIYTLYGYIPSDNELWQDYLIQAQKFLSKNENGENGNTEPDMDLIYDEPYIVASFMSDYKIDLNKENPHFWLFCDLIAGLTEHSVLSRVRSLRTMDVSNWSEKDKREILKAKEAVALPHRLTKEEQESEDIFEARFK